MNLGANFKYSTIDNREVFMNFNNTTFEASFGRKSQLKESICPEIVFSGRSNVGKSSLINKLINRKSLARVSSKPGKTGTINFYRLEKIKLVDLPGYGYAKVSAKEKERWADLVEGYFNGNRNISLVVQIIDIRHKPTIDDINMIDFLQAKGFNFVIVLTKSDKLNKTQREQRLLSLGEEFPNKNIRFIIFSAVNGEGIDNLKSIIESAVS